MVRALLAGSKSQTRRAIKLPHNNPLGVWEATTFGGTDAHGVEHAEQAAIWHTRTGDQLACPYGVPGDRLWVRETLRLHRHAGQRGGWLYAADDKQVGLAHDDPRGPDMDAWATRKQGDHCVSIHMPRWASRILLEITEVRVERLQDISEADAIAEGLRWRPAFEAWTAGDDNWPTFSDPRRSYAGLWDSINSAGAWDVNPWVWAVSFKRLDS